MLKKIILSTLISAMAFGTTVQANDIVIKNRHQYEVKDTDTLWGLSSRFLAKPWYWKDIWQPNGVDNSDSIYPGDVISVEKVDGKDYLRLTRKSFVDEYQINDDMKNVKVEDNDRVESYSDPIPLVDKSKINSHSSTNIITDISDLGKNGRIIQISNGALIAATGDEVYITYDNIKPGQIFEIYNSMKEYKDDDLTLGYEIVKLGEGIVTAISDKNVGLMKILSTKSGVRANYKLLPRDKEGLTNLFPSKPIDKVNAKVIAVLGNSKTATVNDVVLVNRGYNSNLEVGNILSVQKENTKIDKKEGEDSEDTSSEGVGLVLLYKVYDNLSYGLVVRAKSNIQEYDRLVSPE